MAFSDLVAAMDSTVTSTFGEIRGVIHFQDGSPDASFTATVKNPVYEEDHVPGGSIGTGVLLLFVEYTLFSSLASQPRIGDTATINDVDYDIFRVDVDRVSGASFRMRKRNERWDQ